MSVDNEYDHIANIADEISVDPSPQAWKKLERRLANSKSLSSKRKSTTYKFIFSVAAVFFLLLMSTIFIQKESSHFDKINKGKIASWEDLNTDQAYFYSFDQIRSLHNVSYPVE